MVSNGKKLIFSDACEDVLWKFFINVYCYIRHPFLTFFASRQRRGLPCPASPHHVFDKFLWRKIFDRDPSTIAMTDKLAAKQIACDACPDVKAPEILWIGERFEDIPAERLAAGRDHVRIDLYEVDGVLHFSEFTFYNMAGRFGWGIQKEFPQMSPLWDLRRTWFLTQPQSGWRGAYARWLKSRLDRMAAQPTRDEPEKIR